MVLGRKSGFAFVVRLYMCFIKSEAVWGISPSRKLCNQLCMLNNCSVFSPDEQLHIVRVGSLQFQIKKNEKVDCFEGCMQSGKCFLLKAEGYKCSGTALDAEESKQSNPMTTSTQPVFSCEQRRKEIRESVCYDWDDFKYDFPRHKRCVCPELCKKSNYQSSDGIRFEIAFQCKCILTSGEAFEDLTEDQRCDVYKTSP